MNRFINKISLLLVGGSLALASCESLDQNPYSSLATEVAFSSVEDASYWRNGFYRSLRGVSYGNVVLLPDIQSDLLNATIDYGNRRGIQHTWTFVSDDSDMANIWFAHYAALTSINKCIEKFPTVPTTNQEALNQYLGEAYALRAYHFLQLVEKFSPAYKSSNKDVAELGIPLMTAYDVTSLPKRATLEETYNQILSDITQAEIKLAAKVGSKGSNTFTIDAVKALKARVLLNKQEYAQAYSVAKQLADASTYPLVTTADALQKMWHTDSTEETIVQLFVSNPDELPNTNSAYLGYRANLRKYTPDFVPSQWVVDMYESSDLRKSVYFKELPAIFTGKDYTVTLVNKYPGNPALFSGATNYAHAPKIFRIAEMYLIAAEAAYKNSDEVNALLYLNKLRSARGASALSSTGSALFEDVKNERLRELAFEGTRLNDLKRWGDAVKRHSPQSLEYILVNPASQFHNLEVQPDNFRFAWPIPTNDMQTNSNVKQNPGY